MDTTGIKYVVKGDGPTLVLVHGFPFDKRIWKEQVDGLADIARVYAIDLPGFGQSAPLPMSVPPSIDSYADAIAAWVREMGLERKIVLAGHSMGGYVALEFARQYADMLAGLALISTRPGADTKVAKENRKRLAEDVRMRGPLAVVVAMLTKLFAAGTVGRDPGLADRLRDIMMQQSNDAIIRALHSMAARSGRASVLRRIKVPVLVIAGNEDAVIPASEGEGMAARVPKSRRKLSIIAGVGHMPMMENPSAFNAALREALARP
jgi:pimeloyl-ACP methyl ester carboxylesterase